MTKHKGNVQFLERQIEAMARDPRAATKRKGKPLQKRGRATKARDTKAHLSEMEKHVKRETEQTEKALLRVLGPSGMARAVKISRLDASAITQQDVDSFISAGWGVHSASTSPAKAGGALGGFYQNPEADPLGPRQAARSIIISGDIDAEMITTLRQHGWDVSAAPKRYREGLTKNPEKGPKLKVYDYLKARAKKGDAPTEDQITEGTGVQNAAKVLRELAREGLAHVAGSDMFGNLWAPGTPSRGLFTNPSSTTKAKKKAKAWFGNPGLVTKPEAVDWTAPEAVVHIGQLVAIEYESDKFDGTSRIYRHEITRTREMMVSPDGTCIVILPGLKITKRGIEG